MSVYPNTDINLKNNSVSSRQSRSKKIKVPTRLDLEIFIMGDNKSDFISFLGDCFKSDFFETLSWGTFRRFQLILRNKDSWISIYFIIITKEQNMDIILTNFKMYEKRNLLLMFYNINDPKAEKNIEDLYKNFLTERNKIFEGILNDDKLNQNLKKISTIKYDQNELKNNLKFLIQDEDNLVYKIGMSPNLANKNRKNSKKNLNDIPYEISQEIFFLTIEGEDVKTNFQGMISLLIKEHLSYLKYELEDESVLYFKLNDRRLEGKNEKNDKKNLLIRCIDFFIILYFAIALFKFLN